MFNGVIIITALEMACVSFASEVVVIEKRFTHREPISEAIEMQDYNSLDQIARERLSCFPKTINSDRRSPPYEGNDLYFNDVGRSYVCDDSGKYIKAFGIVGRDPYADIGYLKNLAERSAYKYAKKWCRTPFRIIGSPEFFISAKIVRADVVYDCEFQ